MTVQRDYPDFSNAGDTGDNTLDAIQPVSDGEGANQTVFRRPSENLRSRSEISREAIRDLNYHRDTREYVIHDGGGTITWNGTVAGGGTGIVENTGQIFLRPFLTPATSVKASLDVGVAAPNPNPNQVTYSVSATAYASDGMNNVTIEHRDGGVGAALATTISIGPVKRIVVVFDSTNTAHDSAAVKASVDTAVAADTGTYGLATRITVTDNGVPTNTVAVLAETRLQNSGDQEAHSITATALNTFTTARPLEEGDSIAIWYRHVVEPAAGDPLDPKLPPGTPGGRWESNPDRGSDNVVNNLFVTTDDPYKMPGALPLCKVVDDVLVFTDGTRVPKGATTLLGAAADIALDTTNFAGANTVANNGGIPTTLAAPQIQTAMDAIDDRLASLRDVTYVVCDGTASTGGDFEGANAVELAVSALAGAPGVIYLRRGTYTLTGPTYSLPAGTVLVGEGRGVVSVGTGASVLELNNQCELRSLEVTAGELSLPNNDGCLYQVDCQRLDVTGETNLVSQLTANLIDPGLEALYLFGSKNSYRDVHSLGYVSANGTSNVYINLTVDELTGISSASSSIDMRGVDCIYSGVAVAARALDLTGSNAGVVKFGGSRNYLSRMTCDQTASALTAGRSALEVDGATVCLVQECLLATAAGSALTFRNNKATGLRFASCQFTNDSTDPNDATVRIFSGSELAHTVQFDHCTFDCNERTQHRLIDLPEPALIPGLPDDKMYTRYSSCTFIGACLTTNCSQFTASSFHQCRFVVKNPSQTLGGTNTGQVAACWFFRAAGTGSGYGCVLVDPDFDMYDSEVETAGTGDPDIQTSLVCAFSNTDALNVRISNLNRHINTNGTASGLVQLRDDSRLDGLRIEFTSTAPTGGGTANIENVLELPNTVADNVSIQNIRLDGAVGSAALGAANFIGCSLAGTIARLRVENVYLTNWDGQLIAGYSNTQLLDATFTNCTVGDTGSGITAAGGIEFVPSSRVSYVNCRWHVAGVGNGGTFASLTYEDFAMVNCYIDRSGTSTLALFESAGATTLTACRFVGCYFKVTNALTVDFHTGNVTFAVPSTVGAGNLFINAGGGGTNPPSFAASINLY